MNSAPIDLLLLTALTEEAQVAVAVLDAVATQVGETGGIRLYNYSLWPGREACIAVASAHQMGAVAMGVFAAPLLDRLRPRTACLIGIAAAVDTAAVQLGDVPFASQVFSYDDIAVEDGVLTFRTQGYQVDPMMRAAVGELRLSVATYRPWQEECQLVIRTVVDVLNQLRPAPIKPPKLKRLSHLVVETIAGGPFLLRDQDFRGALRDLPKHGSSSVAGPVHPKLVSAEMESHGFMRAAHEHHVGAIVLKGISDVGDKDKAKVEKKTGGFFRAYACSNAVLAALHTLRRHKALSEKNHSMLDGGTTFALSEPNASAAPTHTSAQSTPIIDLPRAAAVATPRRSHFVLNLAGSIADYPPERREVLLTALRTATGDNTVEIVKIEEGSVLVFVSAQTANLATFASPQVGASVKAAGAELLGVVEEESFPKLQAAKAALMHASHDLLVWPQTLPGGERFERPEFNQVLQEFDAFDKSATVVLGPPGSGKSALLARIAQKMAARGWPVLGVKADVLDPSISDETGLQRQLMLDEPPSRLLAQLAEFGPVVLIIDQLDALAGFVDLKTGRLNVLLNLLRRFGQRRNMHVIVSARSFEFKHDVRLRSIEADSIDLELPPWREVLPVLAARKLHPEGWPPDVRETLRTPQHLATFLRLVDSGAAEPSQNYQAMLERLWNERVLQALSGERLARLATDIAETMAREESLWLACSRYDDHAKELQELERLEILTPSADRLTVGFSHQTLYDYVLARSFARGKGGCRPMSPDGKRRCSSDPSFG
ncbi:AAA family ATPase [Cystobacter fuscus]